MMASTTRRLSDSLSLCESQGSSCPLLLDNISDCHHPQIQIEAPTMSTPPPHRYGLPGPVNISKLTGLQRFKLAPPTFDFPSDSESVIGEDASSSPIELVYNIRTSTFRRAPRSELLRKRLSPPAASQPEHYNLSKSRKSKGTIEHGQGHGDFFYLDNFNPPLLVDGRKTVMPFPRFKRTVEVYYRRFARVGDFPGNEVPIRGETVVIMRDLSLPKRVWFERNVLGRWKELWVEMR